MGERHAGKDRSPGAYIAGAVANAIVLFLVNRVPDWNLPFVTDGYTAVLWAIHLCILVQIGGNALLIFIHPHFLHYLTQTVFNVVSLLALIVLAVAFPFDFSFLTGVINTITRIVMAAAFPFDFSFLTGVINTITRIALIVGAVGTGIAMIVNLSRTNVSRLRRHGA
ncbi:MAG: hypothetical protein V3S41_08325 [Spirochaetia bacterium]